MAARVQPWHQRDGETDEQYELFKLYLVERSPLEVAKKFFPDEKEYDFYNKRRVESGRAYIQNLKKQQQWDVRVRAYDRWVAKTRDDAIKKMIGDEVARIRRERIKISRHISRQVDRTFKELDARDEQHSEDKDNKVKLYERELAIKIARAADEYFRKLEESNPEAADEETPFGKDIASAQEQLIAFIEKNKIAQPPKEILQ